MVGENRENGTGLLFEPLGLQKLQSSGVHIIIVGKSKKGISTAEEVKDARESCKSIAATPPPQPTTAPAASVAPQQSVTVAPAAPQTPQKREESLGDAARKNRQAEQQQEAPAPAPVVTPTQQQ